MLLGKKTPRIVMHNYVQDVERNYFFPPPQLYKHVLFKALLFRRVERRSGEKLEEINKKMKRSAEHVQKLKELGFLMLSN